MIDLISRGLVTKLREWLIQQGINVRQPPYNLRADGSDETDTIQKAINDSLARGAVVYFPDGIYGYTALRMKNNLRILGAGKNKATLRHLGTGKAIFNEETGAVGNVKIAGVSLDLNPNTTIGVELARLYQSQISEVHINALGSAGIAVSFDDGVQYTAYYNSCYDVSINGNYNSVPTLGTGFRFANSANSNRLINCRTVNVKVPVDIVTDYTNHILVLGCAFEGFETAIRNAGDMNIFAFNRFENGGTTANGIGVHLLSTAATNYIIGNTTTNVATPVQNDNPSGNNFIFNHGELAVRFMRHETGGGWTSNMDMRGYGVRQAGYVDLKSSGLASAQGRLIYADGTTHNPGQGEGLYIGKKGGTYERLGMMAGTTAQRPTTNLYVGLPYYDTDLGKPIWLHAVSPVTWHDATGATV